MCVAYNAISLLVAQISIAALSKPSISHSGEMASSPSVSPPRTPLGDNVGPIFAQAGPSSFPSLRAEIMYQHIMILYPNQPPCAPPVASIADASVFTSLHKYFYEVQFRDMASLFKGGLAYEMLNEVKTYLRLNDGLEPPMSRRVEQTEHELAQVCHDYLTLWETDPQQAYFRCRVPSAHSSALL